jgi:nucleotide-binding universal stress UspA family protein
MSLGLVVVGAGNGVYHLRLVEFSRAGDLRDEAHEVAVLQHLGFQCGRALSTPDSLPATGKHDLNAVSSDARLLQVGIDTTITQGVGHVTSPILIHGTRLPTRIYYWHVTQAFELGNDGPKVILVGVDESVTSMRAGAYAAGLARRQRARLVCVYVQQFSSMTGAAAVASPGAVVAQEQAQHAEVDNLRRQVEEGAARLGIEIEFIAGQGDPYNELKRIADEVRADAVVVGASTKAGHRFVGSLAVRLVRAGRWPVTVVP